MRASQRASSQREMNSGGRTSRQERGSRTEGQWRPGQVMAGADDEDEEDLEEEEGKEPYARVVPEGGVAL